MDDAENILLVGQSPGTVQSIASVLESAEYEYVHLYNIADIDLSNLAERFGGMICVFPMVAEHEMDFVRRIAASGASAQTVIVTEEISVEHAMKMVEYKPVACIKPPIDAQTFLEHVQCALREAKIHRSLTQTAKKQHKRAQNLETSLARTVGRAGSDPSGIHLHEYVGAMWQQVAGMFEDVLHLTHAASDELKHKPMCRFFVCPRLNTLSDAIEDTLRTLEKTRRAFKSKDLADLRHRLLEMLGRSEKNRDDTKDPSQNSDI